MKKIYLFLAIVLFLGNISIGQDYGNFPDIEKQKLLNDLELIYQGLDKYHSGMYWYTTKNEFDSAYNEVKKSINRDMNVLEFHKLIAPLVSLSREGHTLLKRPNSVKKALNEQIKFLPIIVIFLDKKLYVANNGSNKDSLKGLEIEMINGETPLEISRVIGQLITSDGYNERAKRHNLRGFSFSEKYFYWYGIKKEFKIKFKTKKEEIAIEALSVESINKNLAKRRLKKSKKTKKELLEYKILNDSIAYLGIHTFSNDDLTERYGKVILDSFLKASFQDIETKKINKLIIDVAKNGGGTEGNENLLYSYLGENVKKYKKVRTKTNKVTLDNGIDKPIKFKTYGLLERVFVNKKMGDGSLERKNWPGFGLMAYKKEPTVKFKGEIFLIIGPSTYSGGSEFANLMYSETNAIFVGQETGGGYYGNTSGYSRNLILPNSRLTLKIPTIQFVMNVNPTLPIGRGVIPHYEVIPSIEELIEGRNMPLEFILNEIAKKN